MPFYITFVVHRVILAFLAVEIHRETLYEETY